MKPFQPIRMRQSFPLPSLAYGTRVGTYQALSPYKQGLPSVPGGQADCSVSVLCLPSAHL